MGIVDSKLYRSSTKSLGKRYERLAKGYSKREFEELRASLEHHVVEGANNTTAALGNVRFAAHELSRVGSKRFVRPRLVGYEDIVIYHNTAALHEAGAFRNRFLRLFRRIERHLQEMGDSDRERVVRYMANGLVRVFDKLQKIRDEHVHAMPFVPQAVLDHRRWSLLHRSRSEQKKVDEANKKAARLYARMWVAVTDLMDEMGEGFLDLVGLLLEGEPSEREIAETLDKMETKLDALPRRLTSRRNRK
jgi:hypothetical protein